MTQNGRITKAENGIAIVSVVRRGACGDHCSMCGACKVEPLEIEAICDIDVSVGDLVEISSNSSLIVGGMICLFILPILLPLLLYVVVSNWLTNVIALIVAGTALVGCILLIWQLSHNSVYLKKVRPRVERVIRE